MGDKDLNTCPMTDSQSGVIIDHMSGHSMLAAHQMIGNDAESNRKFELGKLKAKVDEVTPKGAPKKTIEQIVNHWNYSRQEAKKYKVNKVVFGKLTGNPVERTFLRDEKHERVLDIVDESHSNGLSLTSELGMPKVRVIQLPSATVQALMTSSSNKPPTLNSVMKQLQKENVKRLATCSNVSSLQKSGQVYLAGSNSNCVRQPLSQLQTGNSNIHPLATVCASNKKSAQASSCQSIAPGSRKFNMCQSVPHQTSSSTKTNAVSILKCKKLTVNHPLAILASTSTACTINSLTKKSAGVSIMKSHGNVLNHSTVSASSSSQANNLATKSTASILKKNRTLVSGPSSVPVFSSVQSAQFMDTIKNSCARNTVTDIGFQLAHEPHHGLSSINNKSKQILKRRQRAPAKSKAEIMPVGNPSYSFGASGTDSIAKSMSYSQYGNLLNNRNRTSSILAEALQQNAASFSEMNAELRIANDLKREELEMKKQYYKAMLDKNREHK